MIELIATLAVIGVIVWLVNTVVPMPGWMKTVINTVAAVVVVMWLLRVFGLLHSRLPDIRP